MLMVLQNSNGPRGSHCCGSIWDSSAYGP